MPRYIVKKDDDSEESWEVWCSYAELQEMCAEYGLKQIIGSPDIVSGVRSTLRMAGNEWQDTLKEIKKNSGRGNTIKV
jgi:hypothetical protein